jgi:hypothetical protein
MSHFQFAGILVVLEFTDRKTEVWFSSFHRYENQDKLLSDHQFVLYGLLHVHAHIINPQLHMYHGWRCLVTSSHLSNAEIDA